MNLVYADNHEFIRRITEIILENLENEHFGAKELVRESGMSHTTFNRRLHAISQKSANQFIREVRLNKAMEMLRQGNLTVAEVAFKVGFGSTTYFNTCFHEYYKFSPGEAHRKGPIQPGNDDQLLLPAQYKDLAQLDRRKINVRSMVLAVAGCLVFIAIAWLLYNTFIKKPGSGSSPAAYENSLAVLPFKNLNNDPGQEYFSDGMVEAIIDHLFKVGDLKVISRTSSMKYKNTKLPLKEIARDLGVSALLEGSVQKYGNRVRISAQLIDAKTDTHLWSDSYDKDLSDVFLIQSEVAQNVARGLKATLTLKEIQRIQNARLTNNQLAYDYYLKGKYYSSDSRSVAVEMYTKAIQEDPFFAAAYAERAMVYLSCYFRKEEIFQYPALKAREDIQRGMSINPELPELKITLAYYYYFVNRDYDKALKIITELKKITPNMSSLYIVSANILRRQGKWEESMIERKRGLQLDPFNRDDYWYMIGTYTFLHQYDNAIEWSKKGLSLQPDYKALRFQMFDALLGKTGDIQVALKESGLKETDVQDQQYYYTRQYDKLIEFIQDDTTTLFDQQFTYYPKTFRVALIYFLSGNKSLCKIYADSSINLLKEKIKESPNDERFYAALGKCFAFIGNNKEAISYGKKATEIKPIKLDAWQGKIKEADLMEIYIYTKNYDLALDKIEFLLSSPSNLSAGRLMIDPIFDKLRSLPRFKRILATEYKTKY